MYRSRSPHDDVRRSRPTTITQEQQQPPPPPEHQQQHQQQHQHQQQQHVPLHRRGGVGELLHVHGPCVALNEGPPMTSTATLLLPPSAASLTPYHHPPIHPPLHHGPLHAPLHAPLHPHHPQVVAVPVPVSVPFHLPAGPAMSTAISSPSVAAPSRWLLHQHPAVSAAASMPRPALGMIPASAPHLPPPPAEAASAEAAAAAAAAMGALAPAPNIQNDDKNTVSYEAIENRYTKNGRRRSVPFPLKLMNVLSDPNNSHIISWMPGGMSFAVIDPNKFVEEILPKHFKSAKFASFTRKLHRWGFVRVDDISGEFYHELFRKNRYDLAQKMSCKGEDDQDQEKQPKASRREPQERDHRHQLQEQQASVARPSGSNNSTTSPHGPAAEETTTPSVPLAAPEAAGAAPSMPQVPTHSPPYHHQYQELPSQQAMISRTASVPASPPTRPRLRSFLTDSNVAIMAEQKRQEEKAAQKKQVLDEMGTGELMALLRERRLQEAATATSTGTGGGGSTSTVAAAAAAADAAVAAVDAAAKAEAEYLMLSSPSIPPFAQLPPLAGVPLPHHHPHHSTTAGTIAAVAPPLPPRTHHIRYYYPPM